MIILLLLMFFGWNLKAQSPFGKVYEEAITAEEFAVIDSSFIRALDTYVFEAGLSQIRERVRRVFLVSCKEKDDEGGIFDIVLWLDDRVKLWKNFRGCFMYNGYLFCWHDEIPESLLRTTGKTMQLTAIRNLYLFDDSGSEYNFEYSDRHIRLRKVFCW